MTFAWVTIVYQASLHECDNGRCFVVFMYTTIGPPSKFYESPPSIASIFLSSDYIDDAGCDQWIRHGIGYIQKVPQLHIKQTNR